jgi:hypothetical protein
LQLLSLIGLLYSFSYLFILAFFTLFLLFLLFSSLTLAFLFLFTLA